MALGLSFWFTYALLTALTLTTCQGIADIYEKEEDIEKAMDYYDRAAQLYSGEGIDSTANQCKIKVAQFAAELEQCVPVLLLSTFSILSVFCAAG